MTKESRKAALTLKAESLTLKDPDRAKSGVFCLRSEQVEETVNLLMEMSAEMADKTLSLLSDRPPMQVPLGEQGTAAGGEEQPEQVEMNDQEKAALAMENARKRSEWADPSKQYAIYKEEEAKLGLR